MKTKEVNGRKPETLVIGLLIGLLACTIEAKAITTFPMDPIVTTGLQADTVTKKISAAELKKYEGEYVLQSETRTMEVKIFVEGGKLKAHPAGQNIGTMKYVGDHTFIHTTNADIRLKFSVEKGKVVMMTLHQRGKQVNGKRVNGK